MARVRAEVRNAVRLRQKLRRMPAEAVDEVRAQLDAWTIVAMKRMRVLQRPGDVPVTVQATGSALLRPVEGEELRRPTITVRGQHRR